MPIRRVADKGGVLRVRQMAPFQVLSGQTDEEASLVDRGLRQVQASAVHGGAQSGTATDEETRQGLERLSHFLTKRKKLTEVPQNNRGSGEEEQSPNGNGTKKSLEDLNPREIIPFLKDFCPFPGAHLYRAILAYKSLDEADLREQGFAVHLDKIV